MEFVIINAKEVHRTGKKDRECSGRLPDINNDLLRDSWSWQWNRDLKEVNQKGRARTLWQGHTWPAAEENHGLACVLRQKRKKSERPPERGASSHTAPYKPLCDFWFFNFKDTENQWRVGTEVCCDLPRGLTASCWLLCSASNKGPEVKLKACESIEAVDQSGDHNSLDQNINSRGFEKWLSFWYTLRNKPKEYADGSDRASNCTRHQQNNTSRRSFPGAAPSGVLQTKLRSQGMWT